MVGRCKFSQLSDDQKRTDIDCHRLCELVPCYVRKIFAFKWVLTSDTFRLNNRDSLRERFSGDDPSSVFQMESIRKSRMVFNPRARTTAVSVTMDSAATTEFATNMRAYDANTAMHGSDKSVRNLLIVVVLPGLRLSSF
jgi:hypothetical protein